MVIGGALTVAAVTQVASWSPDAAGWDGYGPTLPPRTPTSQPLPADATMSSECQDEWEAALRDGSVREAQEAGATVVAVACRLGPLEDCVPGDVEVSENGRPPEYVMQTCE
ncbi:hypothetical protein [Jiangella endophytica]|uniref:hypothetical protein n=1 Tax=Jiangella endophytica TaxID=1623398 RepID=UPI000E341A70|nr:hypothetical protein [Jiangella endophytica]